MRKISMRWPTIPVVALLFILLAAALQSAGSAGAAPDSAVSSPFYYLSPRPGASQIPQQTTILFRTKRFGIPDLAGSEAIRVEGSESGNHAGELRLGGDGQTMIFRPYVPFAPGESVRVTVRLPGQVSPAQSMTAYTFAFTVSESEGEAPGLEFAEEAQQPAAAGAPETPADDEIPASSFLTAPPDLPPIVVERFPGPLAKGYLFVSFFNFQSLARTPGYLMILDNEGEPVYYDRPLGLPVTVDFKRQPNGLLTYFAPAPMINRFFAINNEYQIVDEYMAGNGYTTDLHDLQVLDNGHALLMIHHLQKVDMSDLVPGGSTEAQVIGCIIQEVDLDNNVIFEWRSWDHISILDTNRPLDDDPLRYIHCNSLEQDFDGNILVSSRHLDEVTKIDRQTGEIIWRMGGRGNDFVFTNDYAFSYQHDARRLQNGNITVYDNGVLHRPQHSRGLEYRVNETTMTVEKVGEYRNTPETYALSMGNMQTLPNGNRLIGWGRSSAPFLTEFDSSGNKLLEFSTTKATGTYRAFRFPWTGNPTWPPVLATRLENDKAHLHFSWNGSTETASYKVFAGRKRHRLNFVETVPRVGFETVYTYDLTKEGFWYFQVVPVDKNGIEGTGSNIAHAVLGGTSSYLSVVAAAP